MVRGQGRATICFSEWKERKKRGSEEMISFYSHLKSSVAQKLPKYLRVSVQDKLLVVFEPLRPLFCPRICLAQSKLGLGLTLEPHSDGKCLKH